MAKVEERRQLEGSLQEVRIKFPLCGPELTYALIRVLFRAWHRSETSCTTDEAWTKSMFLLST